jgi:N-acetylneuraminic acid mutarotase
VARLPHGNHDIFGCVVDGAFYVAGGLAARGYPAAFTYFDGIYRYDPKPDSWSAVARMSVARCYSGVAALDGHVWIAGGGVDVAGKRAPTDLVDIFDPKAGTVARGPSLTSRRSECVAAAVNGRLYLIGGTDEAGKPLTKVESIAPGEPQWRAEPDAPVPMAQFNGCVLGGLIYVTVGEQGLFAYDPARKAWDAGLPKMPPMPPRAAIMAAHAGAVWVMGGWTPQNSNGLRETYRYVPAERYWERGPDLPGPLAWAAAGELNGSLVIAGGAYYSPAHGYFTFEDRTFTLLYAAEPER